VPDGRSCPECPPECIEGLVTDFLLGKAIAASAAPVGNRFPFPASLIMTHVLRFANRAKYDRHLMYLTKAPIRSLFTD
jgi:hypothetical protein